MMREGGGMCVRAEQAIECLPNRQQLSNMNGGGWASTNGGTAAAGPSLGSAQRVPLVPIHTFAEGRLGRCLTVLVRRSLHSNRLAELPEELGCAVGLQWISLNCNHLKRLPESIGR